ncbi:MAG: hypothetical protein HXX20_02185 [Chloroflexi bacterium]|nr:hypothetical protein [Chloroflexota bacterium]
MRRCKIGHPVKGLITIDPYEYQAKFLQDVSLLRLILKSRQTGISQISALEALHDALYNTRYVVLFVSKDKDAAVNLLAYVKTAFDEGCPRPDGLKVTKYNEGEIRFNNGSKIKSVAATKNTGRSFAASAVYMDEAAFPQWAERIYQAIKPTVSTGGKITILSTPDGRCNLFYLLWEGGIGTGYSRHQIHWSSCPSYYKPEERAAGIPPEECVWYKANRPDYTEQVWASEYDCDFVQSGLPVFKDSDVELVFKSELDFEEALPGGEYYTFWDIGRHRDATVGTTYRVLRDPVTGNLRKRIVFWERFEGLPYPKIAEAIDRRAKAYPGKHAVESNSIGDPVISMCNEYIEGQNTGSKSKNDMITALIFDIENHVLESPLIRQLRSELMAYQWDDRKLVQDCVISAAGASINSSAGRRAGIIVSDGRGASPLATTSTPQDRAAALKAMLGKAREGQK